VNPVPANLGNGLSSGPAANFRSERKVCFGSSKKKRNARFAQLVEPSQRRVYRLALRITRNAEDAEDAQQEAMLKAHCRLGQFEGRSRFTTWISRIAINEALMCLRKRRRAAYLPLEEAVQSAEEALARGDFRPIVEGPEAAFSRKELRDLLARAMANLRPAYREVFLLRDIEELSVIETARTLQISISTVKIRTSRAHRELRDYLRNARNAAIHGTTERDGKGGSDGQPVYEGGLI
jgi:RNA polymerase sigma-70 factor (ECF subfamily)